MKNVEVILLQKVANCGITGDVVKVKPGFARNYLFPKKMALRASEENLKYFESQRTIIEAKNAETRKEAEKIAEKMNNFSVTLIRQASERGHLYGSVTGRDIAKSIEGSGFSISAAQVNLNSPIKEIGIYNVSISLHPEVEISVSLNVAKSEEEALQQKDK